jgi:hypothetical protein
LHHLATTDAHSLRALALQHGSSCTVCGCAVTFFSRGHHTYYHHHRHHQQQQGQNGSSGGSRLTSAAHAAAREAAALCGELDDMLRTMAASQLSD